MATSSASLDRSPRANWVEKSGGLPPGIRKVARAIKKRNPSWSLQRCIATAWSMSKKWAAGGSAKGAKHTAGLEALRARNRARQVSAAHPAYAGTVLQLSQSYGHDTISEQLLTDDVVSSMLTGQIRSSVFDLATPADMADWLDLATRYVRTAKGVARYGKPIGSPIGEWSGGGGGGKKTPKVRTGADYVRSAQKASATRQQKVSAAVDKANALPIAKMRGALAHTSASKLAQLDAEYTRRAEALGKAGKVSRQHQAVRDARADAARRRAAGREAKAIAARQAARPKGISPEARAAGEAETKARADVAAAAASLKTGDTVRLPGGKTGKLGARDRRNGQDGFRVHDGNNAGTTTTFYPTRDLASAKAEADRQSTPAAKTTPPTGSGPAATADRFDAMSRPDRQTAAKSMSVGMLAAVHNELQDRQDQETLDHRKAALNAQRTVVANELKARGMKPGDDIRGIAERGSLPQGSQVQQEMADARARAAAVRAEGPRNAADATIDRLLRSANAPSGTTPPQSVIRGLSDADLNAAVDRMPKRHNMAAANTEVRYTHDALKAEQQRRRDAGAAQRAENDRQAAAMGLPGADGGRPTPDMSNPEKLSDADLDQGIAQAKVRLRAAFDADPRRSGQGFADAKLHANVLAAEKRRRNVANGARALPPTPAERSQRRIEQSRLTPTPAPDPTPAKPQTDRGGNPAPWGLTPGGWAAPKPATEPRGNPGVTDAMAAARRRPVPAKAAEVLAASLDNDGQARQVKGANTGTWDTLSARGYTERVADGRGGSYMRLTEPGMAKARELQARQATPGRPQSVQVAANTAEVTDMIRRLQEGGRNPNEQARLDAQVDAQQRAASRAGATAGEKLIGAPNTGRRRAMVESMSDQDLESAMADMGRRAEAGRSTPQSMDSSLMVRQELDRRGAETPGERLRRLETIDQPWAQAEYKAARDAWASGQGNRFGQQNAPDADALLGMSSAGAQRAAVDRMSVDELRAVDDELTSRGSVSAARRAVAEKLASRVDDRRPLEALQADERKQTDRRAAGLDIGARQVDARAVSGTPENIAARQQARARGASQPSMFAGEEDQRMTDDAVRRRGGGSLFDEPVDEAAEVAAMSPRRRRSTPPPDTDPRNASPEEGRAAMAAADAERRAERKAWEEQDRQLNNERLVAGRPRGLGNVGDGGPSQTDLIDGERYRRTTPSVTAYAEVYTGDDGIELYQSRQDGRWIARDRKPGGSSVGSELYDRPEQAVAEIQQNRERIAGVVSRRDRMISDPTVLAEMNNEQRRRQVAALADTELVRLAQANNAHRSSLSSARKNQGARNRADRLAADIAAVQQIRANPPPKTNWGSSSSGQARPLDVAAQVSREAAQQRRRNSAASRERLERQRQILEEMRAPAGGYAGIDELNRLQQRLRQRIRTERLGTVTSRPDPDRIRRLNEQLAAVQARISGRV